MGAPEHFADEKRKAEELELKAKEAVEQRIAVERKAKSKNGSLNVLCQRKILKSRG